MNPKLFKPKQIQTAISPNTFIAQDDGIYANAELNNFWNRLLFTKALRYSSSCLEKQFPLTF